LFVYQGAEGGAKVCPSKFVVRSIESHETYSVVQTLDLEYRLAKTATILAKEMTELIPFPQKYQLIKMTENGYMYCSEGEKITRFNLNTDPLSNGEHLYLKGEVEDLVCGFRFTIAVVRDSPEEVSLLLFDDKEPMAGFKRLETPFSAHRFQIAEHLVMGRGQSYLIFN
jgi:hypothetical protein